MKSKKKQVEKILKRHKNLPKNILQRKLVKAKVNFAEIIAKPVRCVSVEDWNEQAVYCLFEPKTNSFTIEGGLIVHNCDTLRYLCMTKPIMPAEIKKPMTLQDSINKELEIQKLIDKIKEENKLLTKRKR